jgi:hypothetical protein
MVENWGSERRDMIGPYHYIVDGTRGGRGKMIECHVMTSSQTLRGSPSHRAISDLDCYRNVSLKIVWRSYGIWFVGSDTITVFSLKCADDCSIKTFCLWKPLLEALVMSASPPDCSLDTTSPVYNALDCLDLLPSNVHQCYIPSSLY